MKLFILAALSLIVPGDVEPTGHTDPSDLFRPGARLSIEVSDGRVSALKILSQTKAVGSNGRTVVRNDDGNTVRSGPTVFSPHSGYRQPGGKGRGEVGATWSHEYRRGDTVRRRTCEVTREGAYRNDHIVVLDAFLVECTNERSRGQPPLVEAIWFHEDLFQELEYRARWGGDDPGELFYRIIGVE